MDTVSASDARARFGELLDRVSKGEEFVITGHNKAVARLAHEAFPHPDDVRRSAEGLRQLQARIRRRSKAPLTARHIRTAIEHGRR